MGTGSISKNLINKEVQRALSLLMPTYQSYTNHGPTMVDLKPNDFEKSVKEIDLGHDTLDETLKSINKAWYVPPEIILDAEMASKNEKESCKGRVISEGIFYLITFEADRITPYGVSLQLNSVWLG